MAGRPIDEKIVRMRLDDSDFTRKAANTTSTLGKLRDALNRIPGVNLGKTSQELAAIQNNAGSTKLEGMANAVQNISNRFSALGVVAITTLTNITNRAVDAGISLAKSLSLDQVIAGFGEYETKIGAIKTILSNTEWAGTKLPDVNKALGELNEYADQTIYNFGQMTENVGRFTAAGVKLDDSVIAIKGLANLAAASGSDVNQLNSAMYQMSQMLAAGKMNLMDWNSLVNAGMAGKKTQDALLETAKAMGKNVDMSEGFRNSIRQGWLTSEVFLETMKKFGNDPSMIEAATKVRTFSQAMATIKEQIGSGWAVTFENIFGDYEEATNLWSKLAANVSNYFGKASEERNKLTKSIADKGGFTNIFDGIVNAVKPVMQIFTAIGDGFKKAFPPKSVAQIVKMTENFKEFTAGLKLSDSAMSKLTTIFHGAFSIFSSVIIIAKNLGSAFLKLIPEGTGNGILSLLEGIFKLAIGFNESLKAGNGLTKGIDGLGTALGGIGSIISSIIKGFSNLGEAMSEVWNILAKGDFTGKGPWEEDSKIVDWLFKLRDAFKSVGDWFKNNFEGFGISDILGAGTLVGVGLLVKKILGIFDNFGGTVETFQEMISNIGEGIGGVFEDLGDAIKAFQAQVKYTNLLKIAIAVGILAVSLKLMEGIKTEDLTRGLIALGVSLGIIMGGMAIIDKFDMTGGMRASTTIVALAAAVLIMASALKKISDLNPSELMTGLGGLVGITAALAGAIIAISKWGGKIKASSLQLLALAGAIAILADAVKKLSEIDVTGLAKGVGALGVIFLELGIFLRLANKTKLGPGTAIGLIGVATAIQLMVNAIKDINGIDVPGLVKGLTSIAVILAQITIFSKFVSGPQLIAAGIGMTLVAAAINLLVGPIKSFSEMSLPELAKGMTAMAVALGLVAGAAMLASGSIGGAAAILIMAAAMNALVIPIQTLADMTWGELTKGIIGLAAGMALIAGAALLLSPAIVPMLGFGSALLLVGAAALAVGAGIGMFATGLTTLATLTAASVTAIVGAIGLLLKGFADLIPAAVDFVVKLGLALINGFVTLAPPLANAIAKLIVSLLTTITTYLPSFIEKGTLLILQLLEGMGEAVPTLISGAIEFMVDLISGLAQGIRDNGPELVNAMMELIGEIIILVIDAGVSIVNAVLGWIPGVKDATSSMASTATEYIRENFKAADVGNEKGKEFVDSLSSKEEDAKAAGAKVGNAGKDGANSANLNSVGSQKGADYIAGLGSMIGGAQGAGNRLGKAGKDGANSANLNAVGSNKGSDFIAGLRSKTGSSHSAGQGLANSGKKGARSVDMRSTGANFGSGFASGISSAYDSVVSAAKSLARSASNAVKKWLGIRSPSRVTKGFGRYFGEGLAIGIIDKTKRVSDSAKSLAEKATESLNQFLDGFQLPKDENELRFKAVVDYDKLDSSKFGKLKPMTIQPDTSLTSGLITAAKNTQYQNRFSNDTPKTNTTTNKKEERQDRQPAVIQIVTPDKREFARWLVDDVTEFQEFKMNRIRQF